MELKLDRNKTYGLALEGGGAKGAYQIGAWKALREAGIHFSAVSGTSVGALNGAMIVMDDLEKAENVWNNIHFSQVMDVDDEEMRRLMNRDIPLSELKSTLRSVADIVRNRGFDVTPLRNWVAEVVDADKICHSDTDFFIVTYSLSDHQELELKASDLDKDELCDMLLASAYLPAFRLEKLGGKYYTDGGVQDTPSATTPLSAASTVTRHRRTSGRAVRRTPASRMDISSSAPRLPGGLASSACRRRAASMDSRSAGRMDSIYAVNSCLVMCSLHIRVPAATQETGRSPDFPM